MASTTKALALFSLATLASANRVARGGIIGNPGNGYLRPLNKANVGPPREPTPIIRDASRSAQTLAGAEVPEKPNVDTKFSSKNSVKKDLRVRIKVPAEYYQSGLTKGYKNVLADAGGIIFPYTPLINLEHKADYVTQTPLHSNYALNFYRNSAVSDISIQGLFTVQNDYDAVTFLSTVHLLRSLTKMRFGTDANKGAPPPVCRLFAYGSFMLDNTPIAISSFKIDLLGDVDYYHLKPPEAAAFGEAFVPTKSTINLICKPMYSRNEMLNTGVSKWLTNSSQRNSGLL